MEGQYLQMNLHTDKACVLPKREKLEPFGKTEPLDFPKIEKVELFCKLEPLDFPKMEKVEPFCKTEPLHFPKAEQVEPFAKMEPLDLAKTKTVKLFGQPLFESKFFNEERKHILLRLGRIRDFIILLLNYPMRTVHDSKLKDWTLELLNGKHLRANLRSPLNEKPLECLEGLIPREILKGIEEGWSSMFVDKKVIPKTILNLATNLAVDQLLQTLLSGDDDHVRKIHHIMLCTRDGAEKRVVIEKLKAVLKNKETMLRLNETFLDVLFIDASVYQDQVEFHVQQQIAQQLQLQLTVMEGDKVEGNEDWLRMRIEKEMLRKKYLVFLVDGVAEEPLDPKKVGFLEEELMGVVVLITTESSKQANDELSMLMDLKIGTKDHLLPWGVFYSIVGDELLRSSNSIQTIAEGIVEECGSHLLANVLVAKSLKNVKDVRLWELALHKLRWLHPSYDIDMFHGQSKVMVNSFLNFIWDGMDKTQKQCLMYSLFIPEIKYGRLHNDVINSWISSLSVDATEANHNLRELINRSVLLQFEGIKGQHIQISEDISVILQSLNTQNPMFMKKAGLGLTVAPNSELWQSAVHIDLTNNKLSELPLSPNCVELKVLMLHNNVDLTKLPPVFFSKMPLVCIVDLSYTSVRELPNSFFELEQLKELYMKCCECFMKLPPEVGKLKKLEKLDLDKTQIIHLPEEIQELTNLQSLTLYFYEYRGKKNKQYTCSTIIPSGVISKLKKLKYLSIDVNPDDERWHENVQLILPEILELEWLLTFSLYIPQPELLKHIPDHIFMLDFRFVVGQHMSRIISGTPSTVEVKFKQSECSLKLVKGVDVPYEIKELVRHCKALLLDRHMNIKDLSEFGMMNLEQLQVCILAECKEMQTIVDGRYSNSKDIFSRLLLLSVSYMKNLRSIWEGRVQSSYCFGMLKSLALHNCPKLTTIFTLDFLGNLSLLKVLIVKDCPKISTLVTCGSSELKAGTFLPKLRTMLLFHLPELISISNELHMGPILENIGIFDCLKLQRLSKMELSSQNLKVIKGETKWWEALKWSEIEWGKVGRPSKFDHIFSPIDIQFDIMTQLGVDDDIDNGPGEPLQPFSERIFKEQNHNAHRRSETMLRWTRKGPIGDEYNWRKYGQRVILGAKYPRVYYRCIYRNTQGCYATKQVQRTEEDPTVFDISYEGRHTCIKKSIDDLFVSDSTHIHSGKEASYAVHELSSSMDDSGFTHDTSPEWAFVESVLSNHDVKSVFTEAFSKYSTVTELTQASSEYSTVTELTQASSTSKGKQISTPDDFDMMTPLGTKNNNIDVGPASTTEVEPLQACGERRGTYRRRKNTKMLEKYTDVPIDDGHSWRKYGQKVILNAKYPRTYFRCIHKFDQGCQAIKQVQRIQEDPPLYRFTYYGDHTCGNLKKPEVILDSGPPSDSSVLDLRTLFQSNETSASLFHHLLHSERRA